MCEYPEFYDETYPVARKERRCCECHGVIKIGERYVRCVGKWDGEISRYDQHKACRDFAAEVNSKYGYGECFIAFGEVNGEIRNAESFAGPDAALSLQAEWNAIRAAGRGETQHGGEA